ncbi:MAG: V-type ATPase subunit [DPANN group archaeon]|nr:V-type ATPase subunit [DPANN group archaeon]
MLFQLQYASSRVRALRGQLFKQDELKKIQSAKTKEELISNLNREIYENIFTKTDIIQIESYLDLELVNTIEKITQFLPEKFKEDFNIYILRWDLYNIKLMLRGLYANIDYNIIKKDFIQTGAIWNLVEHNFPKDIDSIKTAIMDSIWKTCIIDAITKYNNTKQIRDAEQILDTTYISLINRIKTQTLKEYMLAEIIMKDTLTIIRSQDKNINIGNQLFILKHKEIPKHLEHIKNNDPETNIELELTKISKTKLMIDPFGIGLYIDYIRQKEIEIKTLKHAAQKFWN